MSVLVSEGCHNKLLPTWLKTTEICYLRVLEAACLKIRCWQGSVISEGSRKESFLASSSFLWIDLCSLICGSITPVSAAIFTLLPSLYVFQCLLRILFIGFRVHPNSGCSQLRILTLITSAKPILHTFWGSGWTCLLGATIQPTTVRPFVPKLHVHSACKIHSSHLNTPKVSTHYNMNF